MKILWITEFFPASEKGEITGGVEARCFFVKKYLEKMGHKVQIIARSTGGDIWYTPTVKSLPDRIIFTVKAIWQGINSDFDLIEGTNSATFPVAWLIGLIKRRPVVFWYPDVFQGSWAKMFGAVGIIGDISDWILLHLPVNRYIAISISTKNKLITKGVPKEKIDVVYCGVEKTNIVQPKKFDICVVSRLIGYKKVDELIKVVPPNLKVVIVGQGPERKRLEELSTGKNITFLGHIASHQEVLKTIASSKILCHPSKTEGFGIVLIEAAALGVPFIARDIPVITEITHHGQGGLLFEKNLGGVIKTLLANKAQYRNKVKEAKEIAKEYTWEKAAEETAIIYKSSFKVGS